MRLGFSKSLEKLVIKYVSTYTGGTLKKRSAKDLSNAAYAMFLCGLFSDLLYKSICCVYPFELHQQVDANQMVLVKAIQMGTHNICLYKEVDKKYTDCNLKTTECLAVFIGVCMLIRSNVVFQNVICWN